MAQQEQKRPGGSRVRRTVPVSTRDAEGPAATRRRGPRIRLSTVEIGVLVTVIILILVTIAVPLRNYYQGRSEIARLNESITAKEEEKERLLRQIERYGDEAYIREEARRRLGLIQPGETAFRIINPAMEQESTVTTPQSEREEEPRTWYEVLWDSISTPPEMAPPVDPGAQLPIEPPVEDEPAPEIDVQ